MPRSIASATDYGWRKVIRVVMDDTIPEWVHPEDDNAAHTSLTARGAMLPNGARGPITPNLIAGSECHACVFNQDVREFIFTRDELQVEEPRASGQFRMKTESELVTEIQLKLLPLAPAIQMVDIEGQVI